MQRTLPFAITCGFVLHSVAPVWGQAVNSAELSGVVTDSSGAAVPNATVTATQIPILS